MVIDTDKVSGWAIAHLRIVFTCALWFGAWFAAVRCTSVPGPIKGELPSVVEMFWFFVAVLQFALATVSTACLFYKLFEKDLPK